MFVHGFQGDVRVTWKSFAERIQSERRLENWDLYLYGYSSRLLIDIPSIWSADAPIDRLADALRTRLTVEPLNNYRAIALVAHSMGGLVVQRALTDQDLPAVGHVLLYGTPSSGLVKSRAASIFKRQLRDMAKDSDFIVDLRRRWEEKFNTGSVSVSSLPFSFCVVAGERDEFVPPSSSLEPFADRFRRVIPGDHLSMIRPPAEEAFSAAHAVLIDVLTKGATPRGPLESARVAVEMRSFHEAIRQFRQVEGELDDSALVQYALALDATDRRQDAISVLQSSKSGGTDPLGALAGRFKRLWRLERRAQDAEEALSLYQAGYDGALSAGREDQLFYHAINLAYLNLVFRNNTASSKVWAQRALDHCRSLDSESRHARWRLATKGEAFLLLRQGTEAMDRYRQMLDLIPEPWQARSAFDQAIEIAKHHDDKRLQVALEAMISEGVKK